MYAALEWSAGTQEAAFKFGLYAELQIMQTSCLVSGNRFFDRRSHRPRQPQLSGDVVDAGGVQGDSAVIYGGDQIDGQPVGRFYWTLSAMTGPPAV